MVLRRPAGLVTRLASQALVAHTSSTLDIAPPPAAIGVFSPVFATDDAIVSVVAEPEPGFTRTEDEGLDNLWRYELRTHRWSRVTAFHATGDHWVAIRTPIVRDDGSLEFVLVRGLASATRMPSFELWRVSAGGVASKVRGLPREMYLAGELDGRRVWNIYDQASGEWRLYSEHRPRRWWISGAARRWSIRDRSPIPI